MSIVLALIIMFMPPAPFFSTPSVPASQKASASAAAPSPDASLEEMLAWLQAELRRGSPVLISGFGSRVSFDWLRASGCRVQFMTVTERSSDPSQYSSDNYPPYGRDEYTFNLGDIDPAQIKSGVAKNGAGGWVIFRTVKGDKIRWRRLDSNTDYHIKEIHLSSKNPETIGDIARVLGQAVKKCQP